MNTPTRDIRFTLEELNFLAQSMTWVIESSEGFDDIASMAYRLAIDFQRAIEDINYGHMRVDREDDVQNNTTTKNVSVTEPPITTPTKDKTMEPISITQLTSLGGTIDDPIVIYYTADSKLHPYDEDKREVFICVESKEQSALKIWGKCLDMSQYNRQVISQRGEYKIVPGGDTDGLVNVNFIGSDELHEFTDGIMLVTRAEVKNEAIETWFPQSNNGRFRDYDSDSCNDITQFNGPDSPVGKPNQLTDASLEAEEVIYLYV